MSSPALKILDVFNSYRHYGGEEFAAERIRKLLSQAHEVHTCRFSSQEWVGKEAPGRVSQALRLFYNPDGRRRFEADVERSQADLAIFHNIYPVGSPALYHAAGQRRLPVVQFLHNYRPFAVGGTLYSRGRILTDPLYGDYLAEVREGAWMGSVARSALMAANLKFLHGTGWLKSVKKWIAISDFMRERLIEAGCVAANQIVTLRHFWDALPEKPEWRDAGYYLFLGRLVPEKGIPTLLEAWDLLYFKLGKNCPTLYVAGDGPLASMVRDRARANPYVCAVGTVSGDMKSDTLARCRAVIVPSIWWEPLGLVTYEAYDHGKPVLAAKAGGLNETVLSGVTGFVHEPGNAEELVEDVLAMESMTPDKRAALGAAGRDWLLRETNPAKWLRRFEEIAREVTQVDSV